MIACYKFKDGLPVRSAEPPKSLPDEGWVDLVNPTSEECLLAHEALGIPLEHLRAALDPNERPRLEYADGILLIIARAPVEDVKSGNESFRTCPIAVILRGNLIITVCLHEGLVAELLSRKLPNQEAGPAVRLLLALLLRVSTTFIRHLQHLDDRVGDIEMTLQKSMRNRELLRMLHVEKALIYFLTALKGNQAVLEKLRSGSDAATAIERDLLDDVIIENKQATDMAEIYSQIIGSLGEAFGAIVSNNLNKVMKVLTGLTIVFMIPSIIGALYGMNVTLPGAENPYAFWALCALCLGVSFIVYRLLRKKDWM